jgi:hypothetical protein
MDQTCLFDPATSGLKEPVINIASEVDRHSEVILPTVCDFSMYDMIDDAVNEFSLLTPEQRGILRSLLEHYKNIFASCLNDIEAANYKPSHIDIKPGSPMTNRKPYDLGIDMNEIVRRELERYVHAGQLIPENPPCTAPVFLVCIRRNKIPLTQLLNSLTRLKQNSRLAWSVISRNSTKSL